jgi:hypothetical protein
VERTPAQAFWQDLLLLVPSLALAWVGRPRAPIRFQGARWATVGVATAAAATFAQYAPGLPLDDLATRLKPGTALAELCAGAGEARVCLADLAPELGRGRHWVVLADPAADGFGDLASALNAHDVTPEQKNEIFWRHAPAFALHETPAALLRPLYRTLPRSFLVEEGRVVRTESGVASELVAAAPSTS